MSSTTIRLASERVDQLRAIANHRDLSPNDLLGELLDAEARRLGIADQVSLGGTADACKLEDGRIALSAAGLGNLDWSPEVAEDVARVLDDMASGGRTEGILNLDAHLEIARIGPGIRLRNLETGEKRSFSPSVARDLARLIRQAISE